MTLRMPRLLARLAAVAAIALAPAFALAQTEFLVTVDTTALAGTPGFIDFQMNPAVLPGTPAAEATVSAFASVGILAGPADTIGSTSGTLGTSVVLANDAFSDFFQPVSFANGFSFVVRFDGAFLTAASGPASAFAVALYDGTGTTPLLSSDATTGALAVFALPAGGPVGVTTAYAGPTGGLLITAIPEPEQYALLVAGLAVAFAMARRRRRA